MSDTYQVRYLDGKECPPHSDRIFHTMESALHYIEDLEEWGRNPMVFAVFTITIHVDEMVSKGRIGGH